MLYPAPDLAMVRRTGDPVVLHPVSWKPFKHQADILVNKIAGAGRVSLPGALQGHFFWHSTTQQMWRKASKDSFELMMGFFDKYLKHYIFRQREKVIPRNTPDTPANTQV